jgi:FkbM family methyltransferase
MGYYDQQEERLRDIQSLWGLAETPLPEILTHSGLKYLDAGASERIRGSSAIDGGAYIGDTARLFIEQYGSDKVYALEPEPHSFAALNANIEKWDLGARIVPEPFALSDTTQELTLWGQGMGASLLGKAGVSIDEAATCVSTTIDSYVEERAIAKIGLIKLDIEGAEQNALRGGMKTIMKHRPVLVISIYHTAADFFEIKPMLESRGLPYNFSIRRITDDFIKEFVLLGVPRT